MSTKSEHIPKAFVSSIVEDSPADDAGFSAGYKLLKADGATLHDIIDWRWYSAGDEVTLTYEDIEGDIGTVTLLRDEDQDWGFDFSEALFDEVKQCRNNCTFCFMKQLPKESRSSLKLRDDDFRLSFLQGTFITLTNLTPEDEARIIEQHISPLRVSLHAISDDLRSSLIGKHAAHGIDCCTRLLAAGIEMHMQIVLVPGINDGAELEKTLNWAYEQDNIKNVGIVPIGFTRHQKDFDHSFDNKADAQQVIDQVTQYQKHALIERGYPWVYLADEFYRSAYGFDLLNYLPKADHYGDYELFEDGIGIIRSFVDDWHDCQNAQLNLANLLSDHEKTIHLVVGVAQREFLEPLIAQSTLKDLLIPLPVENKYYGGNVNVTGLLCGCDIIAALNKLPNSSFAAIPSVIFNSDGITLDDMTLEDIQNAVRIPVKMVSCNASEYLVELAEYFK